MFVYVILFLYVVVLMGSDLFVQFICRYGEIVDVNLIRDKGTGKSKGFAFVAYEDQRSTNLAVGESIYLAVQSYFREDVIVESYIFILR